MMRAKSLACAVLLFTIFGAGAAAAQGIELARNLAAEAQTAAHQGKPLLLFVTQPGCAYCERARSEYLRHLAADPAYTSRVLLRELSIDRYVNGFDGRRISGVEAARGLKVKLYPTIVMVDASGQALAAPLAGFTVPDFYAAQIDGRIEAAELKIAATRQKPVNTAADNLTTGSRP